MLISGEVSSHVVHSAPGFLSFAFLPFSFTPVVHGPVRLKNLLIRVRDTEISGSSLSKFRANYTQHTINVAKMPDNSFGKEPYFISFLLLLSTCPPWWVWTILLSPAGHETTYSVL